MGMFVARDRAVALAGMVVVSLRSSGVVNRGTPGFALIRVRPLRLGWVCRAYRHRLIGTADVLPSPLERSLVVASHVLENRPEFVSDKEAIGQPLAHRADVDYPDIVPAYLVSEIGCLAHLRALRLGGLGIGVSGPAIGGLSVLGAGYAGGAIGWGSVALVGGLRSRRSTRTPLTTRARSAIGKFWFL